MTNEAPKQDTNPTPDTEVSLDMQDALNSANSQVAAAMAELSRQAMIVAGMQRKIREQAEVILRLSEKVKQLEPKPPENLTPLVPVTGTTEKAKSNQKQA